jgi:Immunity protein 53
MPEAMDVLDWFARWYEAQCDGGWEHQHGPSIDTIDNPGWSLKIDLTGTDCDGRTLDRIKHNYEHKTDWWTCWTENNVFNGASGPLHLRSLLEAFRDWATNVHE